MTHPWGTEPSKVTFLDDGLMHLDNQKALGAPSNWKYGYLACGCRNDGRGEHVR